MEPSQNQSCRDLGGVDQGGDLRGLHARRGRPGHVQGAPGRPRRQLPLLSIHTRRRTHGSLQHPLPWSERLRDESSPRVHVHGGGERVAGAHPAHHEGGRAAGGEGSIRYDGAAPAARQHGAHAGRVAAARRARRALQRLPTRARASRALAPAAPARPLSRLRLYRHESLEA